MADGLKRGFFFSVAGFVTRVNRIFLVSSNVILCGAVAEPHDARPFFADAAPEPTLRIILELRNCHLMKEGPQNRSLSCLMFEKCFSLFPFG